MKIFNDLLPIKHLVVLLQFTEPVSLRFFHQPLVTAFLRSLSANNSDYEKYISIDTPESGRLSYQQGDYYRFSIFGFKGADSLLQVLIEKLQHLPLSVRKKDKPLAFRDNLKFISLHDGFSSLPVNNISQLELYTPEQLQKEFELWTHALKAQSVFAIRWISPLRFLKEKVANTKKSSGETRYCHNQDELPESLFFSRIHNSLASLSWEKNNKHNRERCPELPDVNYKDNHCFWMDNSYYSDTGREKPMGGLLGFQQFICQQSLPENWLKLLIVGQYTGVGQRRSFGMGRYLLEQHSVDNPLKRVYPAQSILSIILKKDNLDTALAHVLSQSNQHGYDIEDSDDAVLANIISKFKDDNYQIPDLKAFLIDKSSGGQRLLMVPPFWDRVMQRAFAQILSARLDSIMDSHSYGFRKGRSRISAKFDIQTAYREGYRWVYESDIEDFFNQLDISRLMIRLQGVFYNDPSLKWIKKWLLAAMVFEEKRYLRTTGLPQGSPLSPVLANLFLDDFDNDMQALGFRLVRFADDFIILCKTKKQAQQVAIKVEQSLSEHGLSLNKEKTSIRTMEQGFYYLGYLFVNDMAINAKASTQDKSLANVTLPFEVAERFQLDKPQDIGKLIEKAADKAEKNRLSIISKDENEHGIVLCLQGTIKWLSLNQGRLSVMEKDAKLSEQPLSYIQAVVLMGKHQISTQAMQACMKSNIPVYFTSTHGKFIGSSWSYQPQLYGADFWLQQQRVFLSSENSLMASRLIVKSRIISQWEVLRQRQSQDIISLIKDIQLISGKIDNAKNLAELNGYEGSVSRIYFSALSEIIPEEFAFTHRNRRPPKDPVNILLSIGYTLLYNYVDSFLRVNGLFPWLGLYHQPRSGYSPLAADLMEPYRYLVERCVLSSIGLKRITPKDFFQAQDGSCRISDQARKKYLQDLFLRFDAKVKGKTDQQAGNLISHLTKQNHNIALWINNQAELYIWSIR